MTDRQSDETYAVSPLRCWAEVLFRTLNAVATAVITFWWAAGMLPQNLNWAGRLIFVAYLACVALHVCGRFRGERRVSTEYRLKN